MLIEGSINTTCRNLAKVCGKIISFMPALGNICQIMARHLHMAISCRTSWDSIICLNDNVLQELRFWFFHCDKLDFNISQVFIDCLNELFFSDASEYAGAANISGYGSIAHFMWEIEDRTKSSTWRELKTLENILYSISNQLSGKLVKLYTDNQNVTRIVKKGSMKADLQDIT